MTDDARTRLREAIARAYEMGAQDVHEAHETDRSGDFTEAASDYATSALPDLAALLAPPPAVDGFRIGDEVRINSAAEHADAFDPGQRLWIVSTEYDPRKGATYGVVEQWPPKWNGLRVSSVTDGWAESDLLAAAPTPPAASPPTYTASPDHADILETITNAADDWQAKGYTSALAEVRDMANVGRALMEALPDGYCYMDCPSEIVSDLQNNRDEALAASPPAPSALVEAARAIIDRKCSTYKARNGRDVGIQGDDGEKCWIVHSDDIFALEAALAHHSAQPASEGEATADVAKEAAEAIARSFFTSVFGEKPHRYHLSLAYQSMDEMHKAEDAIKTWVHAVLAPASEGEASK